MKFCLFLASWLVGAAAAATPWQISALVSGASYPEGPVATSEGILYVDYGTHAVRRVDAQGATSVVWQQAGCGPSGLVALANGHLVVACYDQNRLVELDAAGHLVDEVTADSSGEALLGPNDLVSDAAGGLYFSTSGVFDVGAPISGKVHYRNAAGRVATIADDLHYANGVALVPDGKTLYVNEHLAGRILRFSVLAPGQLGDRYVFARLADFGGASTDPYRGPDGLKVDAFGRLFVCEFGGDRVLILSPEGKLLDAVPIPAPYVTNVALGKDGELYVTAVVDPWQAPYPGFVFVAR